MIIIDFENMMMKLQFNDEIVKYHVIEFDESPLKIATVFTEYNKLNKGEKIIIKPLKS